MIPTALLLTVSIIIGSLTLFLVIVNWKIYKVSVNLLNISVELLRETVIIRKETVYIREKTMQILDESILLRKAMTLDVEGLEPKKITKAKSKRRLMI